MADDPTQSPTDLPDMTDVANQVNNATQAMNGLLDKVKGVFDQLSRTFSRESGQKVEDYTGSLGQLNRGLGALKGAMSELARPNDILPQFAVGATSAIEATDRLTQSFTKLSQF